MFRRLTEAWRRIDLANSPLFNGIDPADRSLENKLLSFVWLLLAVVSAFIGAALVILIVGVVVTIAVIIAIGDPQALTGAIAALQSGDPPSTANGAMAIIGLLAGINGPFAILFVVLASLILRKRIWASFTSARRFRWRHLVLGLVLYALAFVVIESVEVAVGAVEPKWPILTLAHSAGEIAAFVGVVVVGLIIAAGAEELMFRGWLLRQSAVFTRNAAILLIVNGVLFSAIHIDPDPNAFIARTVMGMVFCYMALRLGGIEFSTGAHAANNILLVLFIEPLAVKPPPPQPFGALGLFDSAALLIIGIAITEMAVRIPALRRFAGIEPPAVSAGFPAV